MKLFAAALMPLTLLAQCLPPPEPDYSRLPCNEWVKPAVDAGWTHDEIPKLLNIIWRESRCQADAIRRSPRGTPLDVGLTQINQVHRRELAKRGFDHLDMTNPAANLWFARWLYTWHEDRDMCGWRPWRGTC